MRTKEENLELYEKRWENAQDIYTGEPLEGQDLKDWEKCEADN